MVFLSLLLFIIETGGWKLVPRFLLMEYIEVSKQFPANLIAGNKHNDEESELLVLNGLESKKVTWT